MQLDQKATLAALERRCEERVREKNEEISKLKTKQEVELKNINELHSDMISRIKKQNESTKT